ncbi:TPA: ATP-binding protein [Escherichia coli]|nr:ATP-binding protein [Escherichia coli]
MILSRVAVMARLADYSNDEGVSWPAIETIRRQIGARSESTVKSAIAELAKEGWLTKEERKVGGRNVSNIYRLNVEKLEAYALSQAKSIADELMTGCTNFVFSGKTGTGKNHLAAAMGNRLMVKGRSVIIVTVSDVMSVLHDSYDNGKSGEKFLQELCGVDLLVLDEIGVQRETKNEQVVLHQIIDRRTASLCSVGMLTNLNHAAMSTLLGERIMDRMTMNGGRWVTFNWDSWRPNVSNMRVVK